MSTCCGSRKKVGQHGRSSDTQPLLADYDEPTARQQALHEKLHSYQMLRALSKGYMPSTEQAIVNLRTLLASDFLNSETPGLSISGRQLLKYSRALLTDIIELLRNKNDVDQIQDFVWYLLKARVSVDTTDLIQTATSTRAKADASAGNCPFQAQSTRLTAFQLSKVSRLSAACFLPTLIFDDFLEI